MAKTVKINGITYEADVMQAPLASDPSQMAVFHDTSDATSVAASTKKGDTFYAGGEKRIGTMPVNGAVDKTLDASTPSVDIPEGYTPGGTVQIELETKTATPSKSAQNIAPTSGKVLSKVTVAAIPDKYQDVSGVTAALSDVTKGKKIVLADGTLGEGTHTDPSFTLANGVLTIA